MEHKRMARFDHFILCVFMLILVGCSTHFTTLQKENEKTSVIYQIHEDRAFQMAHRAITYTFPNREITEINGPMRGYSTYSRILIDKYTQQIMICPAIGTKENGEDIKGYYFEVSGSGTSINGRQENVDMYKRLDKALADTGTGVVVTNVRLTKYETEKKISTDGNQRQSQDTITKSPAEVLRELSQLHRDGIISDSEFEAKKKDILQRM